jgi:MoaA/NifB/PqqE/SkfB family radical SAM enzyme
MSSISRDFPELSAAANKAYRVFRQYYANRSLKAWRRLVLYFYRRNILKEPIPLMIDIGTTSSCQCRCVHCCAEAHQGRRGNELDTAEMQRLIDEAAQLGALQVVLSGGEPLLRKDIIELVRHAHDAGMIIRLNTNGLLLDARRVLNLKKAGLNLCAVSIDDADPETHDQLRSVPGLYAKALEGIRLLRQYNVLSSILTYASKRNVPEGLEKIVDLGRRLGVLSVFIFFPVAVGRWDGAFGQVLNAQERKKVRELQDLTTVYLELITPKTICCAQKKLVIYASAYGDITPCPVVPFSIGNVRDYPLAEFWRRYCADLNLAAREDCPMNSLKDREEFKSYTESIALGTR